MSVNIHLRDTGEGEPVLLLHGWPDTGDVWRHQVAALNEAGYRTIVPDLRGFGASDKPAEVDEYAPGHLLRDMVGVMERLQLPRVHLVGHDLGAGVSWSMASVLADRIASLTVLSVGHPAAFRLVDYAQREKTWYMLLFQFPEGEQWLAADDFRNLREWSGHPEPDGVAARLSDPAALAACLGPYRSFLGPAMLVEPPPQLPPVRVPTMGVWSSGDFSLLEPQMLNSADYVVGPWRYERIEGAGHWLQLDAPGEVSDLLLDFLRKNPMS